MGLFKSMYKNLKKEAEKAMGLDDAKPPKYDPENPPTRWEKAVMGLNGIVASVSKIDPDGVDVVCFPGSGGEGGMDHDIFRNIHDTKGLEKLVTAVEPKGECKMGQAMDSVLKEAFEKGFDERPCAILVLTAGRPDDHEALSISLEEAAKKVGKKGDLTITFVQVGDDEWAEKYLSYLDTQLTTNNADGEEIDIVDTIKDEDVKKALGEIKQNKGTAGALIGAFAGAAMGVGGMYLMNKLNAEKRTQGWNGKWRATFEGDEIAVLEVKDDMNGKLEVSGWPDEGTSTGAYAVNEEGGFNIQHTAPEDTDVVIGTVIDEHNIDWDDGTKWEELPPDGGHWSHYAGAAAAGAAAAGATGYLLDKKFFNKASKKEKADYIIVLDRSALMNEHDTGK